MLTGRAIYIWNLMQSKGSGSIGDMVAKAQAQGITRVVFDRAGYAYHGRVKAVADGARKGGLEF